MSMQNVTEDTNFTSVEVVARESNAKAILSYQRHGFSRNGEFKNRIVIIH